MNEEEFCVCDLWAAEAYITALDAKEQFFLELLSKGIKIHQWILDKTQEKFPIEAKDYSYKDAKQTVHLLDYGGESRKMHEVSRLPQHICDWQYDFFHGSFPGIKGRQQRIKLEIEETQSVTSIFGRKKIFFAPMGRELLNQAYAWPSQSAIGELTLIALVKLYHMGILAENLKKFSSDQARISLYPWVVPSLETHDGLAIRMIKGDRERVKWAIKNAFDIPITQNGMTVTIPVEVSFGPNFNDLGDTKILRYDGTNQVAA